MNNPRLVSDENRARQKLLERIEERRSSISAFLTRTRPRHKLLANVSIVSSAMGATVMGGPALGGTGFTQAVAEALGLAQSSTVWRLLCLAGLILSVVAIIATNLMKSHDLATRLSAAEACNVELEGLQTLLQFGQLKFDEAAELYRQYITKIPFV